MKLAVFIIALGAVTLCSGRTSNQEVDEGTEEFPLLMPNIVPTSDELYLCTAVELNDEEPFYVTGFKPKGSSMVAHHILIYTCGLPGDVEIGAVWNCGEMAGNGDRTYKQGPVCSRGTHTEIIFGWAKDADGLKLPPGVGFKLGGDTARQFLVLQVHYMHKLDRTDQSGVILEYTAEPQPKQAGVLLMGTGGSIPTGSHTNMETACTINEDVELHPFAFRTHTHKLGRVVQGYRVRDGQWTLIGEHDPQQPQMFYPVEHKERLEVTSGDVVAAKCCMVNKLGHPVSIGATNEDEMCNFYMMYWVQGDGLLEQSTCFSAGPPTFTWAKIGLTGAPKDTCPSL